MPASALHAVKSIRTLCSERHQKCRTWKRSTRSGYSGCQGPLPIAPSHCLQIRWTSVFPLLWEKTYGSGSDSNYTRRSFITDLQKALCPTKIWTRLTARYAGCWSAKKLGVMSSLVNTRYTSDENTGYYLDELKTSINKLRLIGLFYCRRIAGGDFVGLIIKMRSCCQQLRRL